MSLEYKVKRFISEPTPAWQNELTASLVAGKWEQMVDQGVFKGPAEYCTVGAFYRNGFRYPVVRDQIVHQGRNIVFLERPSLGYMFNFYGEHDLIPSPVDGPCTDTILSHLSLAFDMLKLVPDCFSDVCLLVRAIQIIQSEGPEYDASYSHPGIPFSIFVSIGYDLEPISIMRVAESILHEAMHLKLTLLEELEPIVRSGSTATHYSPWRDDDRPIGGVLQGLFVFAAIRSFYENIVNDAKLPIELLKFCEVRTHEVDLDIKRLKGFETNPGLTSAGAKLSSNLMKLGSLV